jgi:hypothetical protein
MSKANKTNYNKLNYNNNTSFYPKNNVINKLSNKIAELATEILGQSNKSYSNNTQLRWGSKGSLVVTIAGQKQGMWYDHECSEGGNPFDLIKRELNIDDKEAFKWALNWLGHYVEHHTPRVRKNAIDKSETATDAWKKEQALDIISKSVPLKGTIAEEYLINRGINLDFDTFEAENILFNTSVYNGFTKTKLPALIVVYKEGEKAQSIQRIYLDENGKKLNCPSPKMELGRRNNSYCTLSGSEKSNITLIGEGIETCSSIQSLKGDSQVISAGGKSNIIKIPLESIGQKVVLCLDNDKGVDLINEKLKLYIEKLSKAKKEVWIITPELINDKSTDWNDYLLEYGFDAMKKKFSSENLFNEENQDEFRFRYKSKSEKQKEERELRAIEGFNSSTTHLLGCEQIRCANSVYGALKGAKTSTYVELLNGTLVENYTSLNGEKFSSNHGKLKGKSYLPVKGDLETAKFIIICSDLTTIEKLINKNIFDFDIDRGLPMSKPDRIRRKSLKEKQVAIVYSPRVMIGHQEIAKELGGKKKEYQLIANDDFQLKGCILNISRGKAYYSKKFGSNNSFYSNMLNAKTNTYITDINEGLHSLRKYTECEARVEVIAHVSKKEAPKHIKFAIYSLTQLVEPIQKTQRLTTKLFDNIKLHDLNVEKYRKFLEELRSQTKSQSSKPTSISKEQILELSENVTFLGNDYGDIKGSTKKIKAELKKCRSKGKLPVVIKVHPTGGGKSTSSYWLMDDYLLNYTTKSGIFSISPMRQLTNQNAEKSEKRLNLDRDKGKYADPIELSRYHINKDRGRKSTTLARLPREDISNCGFLSLDEFSIMLEEISSRSYCSDDPLKKIEQLDALHEAINGCELIDINDADFSIDDMEILIDLLDKKLKDVQFIFSFMDSSNQNIDSKLFYSFDRNASSGCASEDIFKKLKYGKTVLIGMDDKTSAQALHTKLKEEGIFGCNINKDNASVDRESKDKSPSKEDIFRTNFLMDPNGTLKDEIKKETPIQYVIYTPVLKAGFSIETVYFDEVFIIWKNIINSKDVHQMIGRYRPRAKVSIYTHYRPNFEAGIISMDDRKNHYINAAAVELGIQTIKKIDEKSNNRYTNVVSIKRTSDEYMRVNHIGCFHYQEKNRGNEHEFIDLDENMSFEDSKTISRTAKKERNLELLKECHKIYKSKDISNSEYLEIMGKPKKTSDEMYSVKKYKIKKDLSRFEGDDLSVDEIFLHQVNDINKKAKNLWYALDSEYARSVDIKEQKDLIHASDRTNALMINKLGQVFMESLPELHENAKDDLRTMMEFKDCSPYDFFNDDIDNNMIKNPGFKETWISVGITSETAKEIHKRLIKQEDLCFMIKDLIRKDPKKAKCSVRFLNTILSEFFGISLKNGSSIREGKNVIREYLIGQDDIIRALHFNWYHFHYDIRAKYASLAFDTNALSAVEKCCTF